MRRQLMLRAVLGWLCLLLACAGPVFAIPSSSTSTPDSDTRAIDDAVRESQSRPVLLYFAPAGSEEAGKLEKDLFQDPAVSARLAAFQMLRIDPIAKPTMAGRWKVREFPALLRLDILGQEVDRWIAPRDRESLLLFLTTLEEAAPIAPTVAKPALQRFESAPVDKLSEQDWVEILSSMSVDQAREQVRGAFRSKKPFPAPQLVTYLEHPLLVVRSGAIDLLEDVSQESFDYDPWKSKAENAAAVAKWKEWAQLDRTALSVAPPTPDELAAILTDLISDDLEKELRGRRALEAGDKTTIEQLLQYEKEMPAAGPRNRLREGRYLLILKGEKNAATLARHLVQGSLDNRINSLGSLDIGERALPIVSDFLSSPEPLEREAAIEALGKIGGSVAAELLVKHQETNLNVRHAILRQAAKLKTNQALSLLAKQVADPSEDLAVTALEGLALAEAKGQADAIGPALKDPRWRVRVAALTAIEKLTLTRFADDVKALLNDPDEFVRISAIGAAGRLKVGDLDDEAIKLFRDHEELRPALVLMYSQTEKALPEPILAQLDKLSKESLLGILGALREVDAQSKPVVDVAVRSADPDVAAAGLRKIASTGISNLANIRTMIAALNSGDVAKQRAIIMGLDISGYELKNVAPDRSRPRFGNIETRGPKPGLELMHRMADAFSDSKEEEPATVESLARKIGQVMPSLPVADQLSASVALVTLGEDSAASELAGKINSLTDGQKEKLAASVQSVRTDAATPLIRLLLQDTSDGVRAYAVSGLMDEPDFRCSEILVEELEKPNSKLASSASILSNLAQKRNYTSQQSSDLRRRFLQMVKGGATPELRVLGIYGLQSVWEATTCEPTVEWALKDGNPYLRRAAADALSRCSPAQFAKHATAIAGDSSPLVRQIVPEFVSTRSRYWTSYLSEGSSDMDYRSNYGEERNRRLKYHTPEIQKLVDTLAGDTDPQTSIQANLALIEMMRPIDVTKVLAAMKDANIAREVSNALESLGPDKFVALPREYGKLFANVEGTGQIGELAKQHFAKLAEAPSVVQPVAKTTPIIQAAPTPAPAKPTELELAFFVKPGCHHCEEVASMLNRIRESFPEVRISEFNINKNRSLELNEHLSKRFGVPDNLRLIAPAIFAPGGYLIKDDISEERIAGLVLKSRGQTLDLPDAAAAPQLLQEAGLEIEKRYAGVNIGVILAAGALDGLNPCAFATIIFLLSYLQIARRTRTEIVQVGVSYIAGVFLTYFLLGLGLAEVVAKIKLLRGAASILNLAMGSFALVVGLLSVRDAVKCLQGRMDEMALQLPGMLKERIHGVIRGTARHRRFVVFAFAVGGVVSLLEMACTGQVYAPTISYMLQSGNQGAAGYLFIYNLAFIVPLSAVFVAAAFGMGSAKLIDFLKRNAAMVKFATALLFLVLAFFLISREL